MAIFNSHLCHNNLKMLCLCNLDPGVGLPYFWQDCKAILDYGSMLSVCPSVLRSVNILVHKPLCLSFGISKILTLSLLGASMFHKHTLVF